MPKWWRLRVSFATVFIGIRHAFDPVRPGAGATHFYRVNLSLVSPSTKPPHLSDEESMKCFTSVKGELAKRAGADGGVGLRAKPFRAIRVRCTLLPSPASLAGISISKHSFSRYYLAINCFMPANPSIPQCGAGGTRNHGFLRAMLSSIIAYLRKNNFMKKSRARSPRDARRRGKLGGEILSFAPIRDTALAVGRLTRLSSASALGAAGTAGAGDGCRGAPACRSLLLPVVQPTALGTSVSENKISNCCAELHEGGFGSPGHPDVLNASTRCVKKRLQHRGVALKQVAVSTPNTRALYAVASPLIAHAKLPQRWTSWATRYRTRHPGVCSSFDRLQLPS